MIWKEEFEKVEKEIGREVDGIDFVPLTFNPCTTPQSQVYNSFTKEEFLKGVIYPRSDWFMWYIEDGLKKYIVKK